MATVGFLQRLVAEGADAYQLFDSWAGMLDPEEYRRLGAAAPRGGVRGGDRAPRILFVKECPYLEWMAQSGADVVSLGVHHNLAAARATTRTWFSRATWMRTCFAPERWSR